MTVKVTIRDNDKLVIEWDIEDSWTVEVDGQQVFPVVKSGGERRKEFLEVIVATHRDAQQPAPWLDDAEQEVRGAK